MTTTRCLGCWLMLLSLACVIGCTEESPLSSPAEGAGDQRADESTAAPEKALPDGAMPIGYGATLHHINPADLDGDGRQDLTLSAHVEGRVETYYQQEDRGFFATGPLADVGFHPNGTVAIADDAGHRYLVLNAEASNLLRTYRAEPGVAAPFVAEVSSPAPNDSIVLHWPGWGRILAVVAKSGAEVRLFKGFDPLHPGAAPVVSVMASPKTFRDVAGLAAADLDGDGTPVVVVAVPSEGRLVAISPAGTDSVATRDIWSFARHTFAHVVLPVDFDGDGDDDLFVLGEQMPHATLLLSGDGGQFTERTFTIEGRGAQSGQVTLESDGSLVLWVAGEHALIVFRWQQDRMHPPERWVLERPGGDWIRFAAADLDGDGHQDLVLGSSVGFVPPTAVYGPLVPRIEGIGRWFSALQQSAVAAHKQQQHRKNAAAASKSALGDSK